MITIPRLSASLLLCLTLGLRAAETNSVLANDQYRLTLRADHSVTVEVRDVPVQTLTGEFTVLYSARDPGFTMNRVGPFNLGRPKPFPPLPLIAQRWSFYSNDPDAPTRELDPLGVAGEIAVDINSHGERSWSFRNRSGQPVHIPEPPEVKGTTNPYLAGTPSALQPVASSVEGRTIRWRFAPHAEFELSAELMLPQPTGDPQIRYQLQVRKGGFFSVGFTGAPWIDAPDAIAVPQEFTVNGRPSCNYLLSEAHLAFPRVHLATEKLNSVLVIDPAESPFRLVEDSKGIWTYVASAESNSRFGLMLESKAGQLRPVAFAPIMGGHESRMEPGQTYTFASRYVLRGGRWDATYRYLARETYRFRDLRDNSGTGPLARTLENLMDYVSTRDTANYCMWHDEQKYYNYWSDQSGIFKPFSPLFGLSAAIVTDDEEYYRTRVRPMLEFALSRKSNVFAPYDVAASGMVSTVSAPLGAPYPDIGQLTSLDALLQHRTYAVPYYIAQKGFAAGNATEALAQYRATGRKEFLTEAVRKTDLAHANYMDLLELYEETAEPRFLEAALAGAYRYIAVQNLFPVVPDTNVTVDVGGRVPIHGHAFQRHEDWGFARPPALATTEQTVPAWRASLIGTELSAYRGGYWLNNHAQLLRLATYVHDDFLRDLQRWAMVGRFANYAGDFRSNTHSLVAEQPDAPMHYIYETNYSTFNPGHACEWIGAVIDFTVSDLFNRSDRQIDFPSRSMYQAGFRVKVYGDRPGRFYDEKDVHLWLPRHLLTSDNPQIEYVAGYGNGKLYLAFWNQSSRPEQVTVTLSSDRVPDTGAHSARLWRDNQDAGRTELRDNRLSFTVGPKGIVAYAIADTKVNLGLQAKLFAPAAITLGPDSLAVQRASFGQVSAMLLTLGKGLTLAFVYTDAPAAEVIAAKLKYRQAGGEWQEKTDAIFPYEFSTEIDEAKGNFECVLEIETADQRLERSSVITLKL